MSEYPKHVYKDGDVTKASRVVKNADEEAAAKKDGYVQIARSPVAPERHVSDPASAEVLAYPLHVYQDGDLEQKSRIVKNAEEELQAQSMGYQRMKPQIPREAVAAPVTLFAEAISVLDPKQAIVRVEQSSDRAGLEAALKAESRLAVEKAIEKRLKQLDEDAAALEAQKKNAEDQQHAEDGTDERPTPSGTVDEITGLSAKDAVEKIGRLRSVDRLKALRQTDSRATVVAAIDKRLGELTE